MGKKEAVKKVLTLGKSGGGKTRIVVDEETDASRCEAHPAGHPMVNKENKEVCLFVYDDDSGEPVDGVEVENITPGTAKVTAGGESKKIEV